MRERVCQIPEDPRADGDQPDRLIIGDAVDVAGSLPDGSVALVYLDPPFGAGRVHRGLKGRGGRSPLAGLGLYDDRSAGAQLEPWLVALLSDCRRILKPGGALFLHLDWRTAHRARIVLDDLFGPSNFLNEIVWHYATGGIPARWFARKHDTILYYRNGAGHTFHPQREKKYLKHRMARRGVPEWQDAGGWYRYRLLDDVWEIPWLTQDARERTGWPTQKPEALLERILLAASDAGDLVADFCCGSGTTPVVAQKLGRRWIASDREPRAIEVSRARLEAQTGRSPLT